MIFLPRYVDTPITVEYGDSKPENAHTFTIPAYTVSGTHLTISVASPPSDLSLWSLMKDEEMQKLLNGQNASNTTRQILRDIYNMGVMICADALMFTETNRSLYGGYYYGSGGFLHGRFAYNGGSSRFIIIMPGQTLHLISAVENVNGTKCLTWYVQNASDFEPLSCRAVEDIHSYTFYGEVDLPNPQYAITEENWQDIIVGSHKINPAILLSDFPNQASADQPKLEIYKSGKSWGWNIPNIS